MSFHGMPSVDAGRASGGSFHGRDHRYLSGVVRHINKDSGTTVLVIEHILDSLIDISNRMLILDNGEVIYMGDPEGVRLDSRVIEVYLGDGKVILGEDEPMSHHAETQAILAISNLDCYYGALQVLRKTSLTVPKSEVVALFGPNGHGKSNPPQGNCRAQPSPGRVYSV